LTYPNYIITLIKVKLRRFTEDILAM